MGGRTGKLWGIWAREYAAACLGLEEGTAAAARLAAAARVPSDIAAAVAPGEEAR